MHYLVPYIYIYIFFFSTPPTSIPRLLSCLPLHSTVPCFCLFVQVQISQLRPGSRLWIELCFQPTRRPRRASQSARPPRLTDVGPSDRTAIEHFGPTWAEATVVDVGAGTGLLSVFISRAGARKAGEPDRQEEVRYDDIISLGSSSCAGHFIRVSFFQTPMPAQRIWTNCRTHAACKDWKVLW